MRKLTAAAYARARGFLHERARPLERARFQCEFEHAPRGCALQRNLDWEIEHQEADGSWRPNWDWGGAFPEAWAQAERWWRGDVTLRTLRMLRAYGRIDA